MGVLQKKKGKSLKLLRIGCFKWNVGEKNFGMFRWERDLKLIGRGAETAAVGWMEEVLR